MSSTIFHTLDSTRAQLIFQQVKPLCVALMKLTSTNNPNSINSNHIFQQLQLIIQSSDSLCVLKCFNYIMYPISNILHTYIEHKAAVLQDTIQSCLQLCHTLIECSTQTDEQALYLCSDIKQLNTLHKLFMYYIAKQCNENVVVEAMHCIYTTLVALDRAVTYSIMIDSNTDMLQHVHSDQWAHHIGFIIHQLIELSHSTAYRQLKIECVVLIQHIYSMYDRQYNNADSLLLNYVPGVSTALCKLAIDDYKAGSKLISTAIQALNTVMLYAISDNKCMCKQISDHTHHKITQLKQSIQLYNEHADSNTSSSKHRSIEWTTTAVQHITLMIQRIHTAHSIHPPHQRIDYALLQLSASIVTKCRSTLKSSFNRSIDYIVSCLHHHQSTIVTSARQYISTVVEYDRDSMKLIDRLQHQIYELPQSIHSNTSKQQLYSFNLLCGYLIICPPTDVQHLITSDFINIYSALVKSIQIDYNDINVLATIGSKQQLTDHVDIADNKYNDILYESDEQKSCQNNNIADSFFNSADESHTVHNQNHTDLSTSNRVDLSPYYEIRIQNISDDMVYRQLIHCMQLIGMVCADVVDTILDLLINALMSKHFVQYRNATLLLINQIVIGCSSTTSHRVHTSIQLLLNEYISHQFLQRPLQAQPYISNQYIVTTCLILHGVADIAQSLQSAFQSYLMYILYDIIAKLGDNSSIIQQAAYATLQRVAISCDYNDVPDLIVHNADYIVDTIADQLHKLGRISKLDQSNTMVTTHTPVAHVINALLTRTKCDITLLMPHLEDVLQHVLDNVAYIVDSGINESNQLIVHNGMTRVEHMSIVFNIVQAVYTTIQPSGQPSPTQSTLYQHSILLSHPSITQYNTNSIIKRINNLINTQLQQQHNAVEQRNWASEQAAVQSPQQWYNDTQQAKSTQTSTNNDYSTSVEDNQHDPLIKSQQIVQHVILQCRHFISSSDPHIQYITLQIINVGVQVLHNNQRELLPVLAKIWPAYRQRLQIINTTTPQSKPPIQLLDSAEHSSNHTNITSVITPNTHSSLSLTQLDTARYSSVFIESLNVLCTMANCAARFLAARFGMDVWPVLSQLLQVELSHLLIPHSNILINERVILSTISTLSNLLTQPDLIHNHLIDISEQCAPYLHRQLSITIQHAAIELFNRLMRLDSDIAYYTLISLCPTATMQYTRNYDCTDYSTCELAHSDVYSDLYADIHVAQLQSEYNNNESVHNAVDDVYIDNVMLLLTAIHQLPESIYTLT